MKNLFLFIFVIAVSIFSQNITVQNISGVNIVSVRNSNSIVSQIPQSYPGEMNTPRHVPAEEYNSFLFNWVLKFTAGGRVFKDISFANTQVGYIVTELGYVYKTSNGGDNWAQVLGLGFPYYWYGVHALSPDTVVIAGFNNQGAINTGVVRWSLNGGTTWSSDIVLRRQGSGVGWLDKVHFFNQNTGIVFNALSGACYITTTGGKDTTAWTFVVINSGGAWISGNVDAQSSGRIYATGIYFCRSTNFGANWVTGPSADNIFDGGVDFLDFNNLFGWTGGGQISAPVSGWTHRTTDGGTTWGPRQNVFSYPIRAVYFFNENSGFAIGGNVFGDLGGIHSTSNGGANWNLEINTSAEMFSMDYKLISADSIDVWCVGSTGGSTGYTGKLYKARIQNLLGVKQVSSQAPDQYMLMQNYPNPFNPITSFGFRIVDFGLVKLSVFDILGNEVAIILNKNMQAGEYSVSFNGSSLPSGVYFYQLEAGQFKDVKKMMLVK